MIPKLLIQNFYFHNFCSTKSNLFTVEPESKIIDEVKEWILTRNHQDHLPKTKSKLQNTIEPKCFVRVKVEPNVVIQLLEELAVIGHIKPSKSETTQKPVQKSVQKPNKTAQKPQQQQQAVTKKQPKANEFTFQPSNLVNLKKMIEAKTNPKLRGLTQPEVAELALILQKICNYLNTPSPPSSTPHLLNSIKQFCSIKRQIAPNVIIQILADRGFIRITTNSQTNEEDVTYLIH